MITLKNVSKEFQLDSETSVTPVRDVSLEIERGEFVIIVGRSGSGKTTLLNLCAGLIKPTSGQVLIDGKDIQSLDEKALSDLRSKKIGFVFQAASMLPSLSVIENVAVPTMFAGEGSSDDRFERAAEVLELVGLHERMEALPRQLSGGEARRVAIARALMNRPQILIADEPTSDLDVHTELKIIAALQKIHETGVTVLMVTHSLELIPYATRAFKMEEGGLAPLQEGQAHAPRVAVEPAIAAQSRPRRPRRRARGWASILRTPANAGYIALAVAFIVLLIAFGITLDKVGSSSSATPSAAASGVGPALNGTNSMGMSSSSGQYDPTQYNLYGNTGMYTSAMMGVDWPLKIDPAPGDPFKDPPVLENTSKTVGVFEGKLEAKKADISFNGQTASLMTYNGTYPGPIINVKKGDKLKIDYVNSLPATTEKNVLGYEKNHTNLHTHGLHVSPKEPSDNVMIDLAPGQSYNYEYDLSLQDGGTLNFIHPHVHGSVAEQVWSGLLATLLVEDEVPALKDYESHVMVLKDIAISGNEAQPHLFMTDYMYGKEGNIVTVNGQINPVLDIKPGQVQRWRILNGSNARFYRVYLENHLLYLVGTDGGLLDKPYPVSSLLLSPGERVDVLVKSTDASGSHKLISLPYARMMGGMGMGSGMMGQSMTGQNTTQAGVGSYSSGMGMMGMSSMGMSGAGTSGTGMNPYGMYGGTQNPAVYAYWPVVTDLLKLTTTEILTKLMADSSLVEIAQAGGFTEDQLTKTVLDQTKATLDQYSKSGYMTQEQVAVQLSAMEPIIKQALSIKGSAALTAGINGMSGTTGTTGGMGMSGGMGTPGGTNGAYNPFMYDSTMAMMYGTGSSASGMNGSGTGGMSGMGGMSDMGAGGMCPGMIGTMGMGMYDMSASTQVTLLTMTTKGDARSDDLPSVVDPGAKRLDLDLSSVPKRTLVFGMDMGNGYINGQDFDVQPVTISSQLGTHEVWELVNQTGMDHPFHLHLTSFQVLSVIGGDADYARLCVATPAMKDVVIVPRMGSVRILVPVKDFDGTAMFHCHILEHEDIGMMGLWQISAETSGGAGMDTMTQ